ncbi:UNVERIFIED_ORG: hypothetical protein LHK14_23890 (plasmid) [Roseateles sp. XES5]|nr:hypothetical protein [Roseateles sp. XES5]
MVTSRALVVDPQSAADTTEPRIGGGALIGGIAEWPKGLSGTPLVLAASLPAAFLSETTGIDIGSGRYASVFTTYAPGTYFLDEITYDGDPAELALLRRGATQVLVHDAGGLVRSAVEMPSCSILLSEGEAQSRIGGAPELLQEEDLAVDGLSFALQLYGGDLPFRDLFYLADGVGYLYLPSRSIAGIDRSGLFFVQVT